MDKIVYRNPSKSEVIGRCGVDEKTEWSRKSDKSRTLTKIQNNPCTSHSLVPVGFRKRCKCLGNGVTFPTTCKIISKNSRTDKKLNAKKNNKRIIHTHTYAPQRQLKIFTHKKR